MVYCIEKINYKTILKHVHVHLRNVHVPMLPKY